MALKIEPWKPPGANEVEMAAVIALYRHGLAAQTPPEPKSSVSARNLFEGLFAVPKTAALIARAVTGKAEGVLVFRNEPPAVRIVYVAALEQRLGIGSQLLKTLRDLCASKGVKELRTVYSEKDERAKSFFTKKHGFVNQKPAGEAAPGFPLVEAAMPVPAAART